MCAMSKSTLLALAVAFAATACDRGDLGDEVVTRCVPQNACDDAMFQGGIKASLGDARRGGQVFAANCARCHGMTGHGENDARAIDMTSPAWQASLRDAAIVKTVRAGRGMKMPAFALPDQDLRDLLAFIRSLEAAPKPSSGMGSPSGMMMRNRGGD